MHFHGEVWLPEIPDDPELAISEVLSPFRQVWIDKPGTEDGGEFEGIWDWYQIGGRWKGVHVPSYDASNDPEHKERCRLCDGTGQRVDMHVENGCNSCQGTGIRDSWPTQWRRHPKDICPVSDLPDDFTAYCLLVNGTLYTSDTYDKGPGIECGFNRLVIPKLRALGLDGGYLVTIDYHC